MQQSRPLSGLALCAVLAVALLASCETNTIPVTVIGQPCMTDDDCDPGDNCIQGTCQGDSSDGGAPDAGTDAGADAGHDGGVDAGTDGGSHDGGGILGLAPLTSTISADAGTAPAPIALTVSNKGTAALHWSAACTNGVAPAPAAAALNAGASASLVLTLPTWTVGGNQAAACTISSVDATGGPLTWMLSATVSGKPPSVTTDGGAVDLLDFSFTGDTRPGNCDDATGGQTAYPQAVFEGELTQMAALSPQFGFDLGDHMYVCSGSAANAKAEMKLYTDALTAQWPASLAFFMTMGNHECEEGDCSNNPTDPNWVAYAAALKKVSAQTLPYYSFQVSTRLGRASFIFVADHYFDSTAQSWLKSALKDADANSAYTFIIKHYPVTGSRAGPASITSLIEAHHYSMVLTAHEHEYSHDATTSPWSGRSVICGLGGANTDTGNEGFCRVQQMADGSLVFTQYGLAGNPGDSWSVSARQ